MTYHTVDILIPLGPGDITIEVNGVKGSLCTDITKSLEEALGGNVTSRKEKPEYFEAEEILKDTVKMGV